MKAENLHEIGREFIIDELSIPTSGPHDMPGVEPVRNCHSTIV